MSVWHSFTRVVLCCIDLHYFNKSCLKDYLVHEMQLFGFQPWSQHIWEKRKSGCLHKRGVLGWRGSDYCRENERKREESRSRMEMEWSRKMIFHLGRKIKRVYLKVWTLRWDQIDQKHRNSQEKSKVGRLSASWWCLQACRPRTLSVWPWIWRGCTSFTCCCWSGPVSSPVEQIGLLFSSSSLFPLFNIYQRRCAE